MYSFWEQEELARRCWSVSRRVVVVEALHSLYLLLEGGKQKKIKIQQKKQN